MKVKARLITWTNDKLEWEYKGTKAQTIYKNKEDRDKIYAQVLEELTKPMKA
jgi:hypothetical protein